MVIKRENKRFGLFNSLFRYAPQRIEQSKKKHHKSGDLLLRKIDELLLPFTEALNLRPSERIHLIEMLAQSLDKSDEKIERVWAKESEERYYALTKGKVTTIPLEQIIEKYKQ